MSEVLSEIVKWISDVGIIAYIVAVVLILLGIILIRRTSISATNRSVSFNGSNTGHISTGDTNKESNGFLTTVSLLGLLVMCIGVVVAYLAWKFPQG